MGEIILNGKSYNSGTKYLEVTQAQYNALPASKLTDGTLYCITDAPGPGEGFPPMIYSYEEREVGVWVDGKPLYQKTITFTSTTILNINTWYTIADVSDLNIDILTDSLLRSSIGDYTTRAYISQVNDGNFKIFSLTSAGWLCDSAVLWYTKTTDVAGAGTWLPNGTQAHHYSTDEHIIGTWIDGKTLYEKTIEFTTTSTANTYTQYVHGIANVDVIMIDFSHSYLIYNETSYFQIIPYAGNVGDQEIRGFISKTSFDYRVGDNTKGKPVKLTVQYTKTTD